MTRRHCRGDATNAFTGQGSQERVWGRGWIRTCINLPQWRVQLGMGLGWRPLDLRLRLLSQTSASASTHFHAPRGASFRHSIRAGRPGCCHVTRSLRRHVSRGLVQSGAAFARHSLSELSAPAAVADTLPSSSLVGIEFHRGLTTQHTVERDEQGRSSYATCAPSYVDKTRSPS